jgi:hypothetical protein
VFEKDVFCLFFSLKDVFCLLLSLYTEDMAARLRKMDVGVCVGDERLNMLLYADVAVIMSENGVEV